MIYAAIFDSQHSRRHGYTDWRESIARWAGGHAVLPSRAARYFVVTRLATTVPEYLKYKVWDRRQPGDAVASALLMLRATLQVGARG
jgi:hypothetical protein